MRCDDVCPRCMIVMIDDESASRGKFTSHDDSPGHQHSRVLSRYDLIIEALM
jgi:hypothetical protein